MRKKENEVRKSQLISVKGSGMQFLVQFGSFQDVSLVLHTPVICSDLLNYSDLSLFFSIRWMTHLVPVTYEKSLPAMGDVWIVVMIRAG